MKPDAAKPEVLVIDDEPQIRRLLRLILEEDGYAVREAETGKAGQGEILRHNPDAIILDLGLPDEPGVDVLRRLREWNATPVLILSVFGQEGSKVAGLDAGADDYLTKPFGEAELLARLRALLRRIKPAVAASKFRFGRCEVDLAARRVTRDGHTLHLTTTEYALLRLFITHRDKVLTHRQILRELWGPKAEGQTHYLRTYMLRLRRKLEDDLEAPRHFQTESGVGYRFLSDPADAA
ncbi:MAG: response regulator [Verrucomicrobia bacterium]|nr:response regulator [Verrucomicrobiota bacterium]